jgi:hypothetical protein
MQRAAAQSSTGDNAAMEQESPDRSRHATRRRTESSSADKAASRQARGTGKHMTSTTMRLAPSLARRQGLTLLALLPGVLVLLTQQGRPALFNLLLALSGSLLTEMACLALRRQPLATSWRQAGGLLTGLLLALLLPLTTPAGLLLAACMIAILLRQLFGGAAHGPFHPLVASLLLLSPWLPATLPTQNVRSASPCWPVACGWSGGD